MKERIEMAEQGWEPAQWWMLPVLFWRDRKREHEQFKREREM